MLEKSIKDHPIVVVAYTKWLVSIFGRNEATGANIMATKLKDKVHVIYFLTTSAFKSINQLKTSVASANKESNTAIRKLGSLAKN